LNGDLALSLSVSSTLVANPGFTSRHLLSMTATAGQTGIAPGDATIAQSLAGVFTTAYSYGATGGLSAMNSTIADYAAAVIGFAAGATERARNDSEIATSTMDSLNNRLASTSGVSIDEEMFEQLENIIR
jgi:flagellar hook-associated protein FlgK